MLDRALSALGTSLDAVDEATLQSYLESAKAKRLEDLLADIALGNSMPRMVARKLCGAGDESPKPDGGSEEAIMLTGGEGHVVSYGKCCHPIPGDPVVGYLSAGKGIVVHRRDACPNVEDYQRRHPERLIRVEWDPNDDGLFSVALRVEVHNRPGVLATIASAISETDTNIEHVAQLERDGETTALLFTIAVHDRRHLARVMRRVRGSQVVISVHRDAG